MKLTKEAVDVKKFRKMWMDKVYFKDMAKEFNTNMYYIRLFGKELGLPKRDKIKKDHEKFKKMWLDGDSVKDILKETGVSIGYFHQLRIRLDLKRRRGKVDYKKFKKMYLQGDSRKDITKEFGIHLDYFYKLTKKLGLIKRDRIYIGAPRRVNYEKLEKMWLDGVLAKDIAEELCVCNVQYVTQLRKKLHLPPRNIVMRKYKKKLSGLEHEKKVIRFLEGLPKKYTRIIELKKHVSGYAIQRLIRRREIFKIYFCLFGKSAPQATGRHQYVFKYDFERKTFICLNRTSVVRLLIEGCKLPKRSGNKCILSRFLKRYLSEAESCAVLWNLGQRKWIRGGVKQSVQVDGILFASKKKEYDSYIRSIAEDNT